METIGLSCTAILIIATCLSAICFDADIYEINHAIVCDFGIPLFQLNGMIFGGYSAHEYGHYLQQAEIGNEHYYIMIVAPSVIANIYDFIQYPITHQLIDYHSLPWEKDADIRAKD